MMTMVVVAASIVASLLLLVMVNMICIKILRPLRVFQCGAIQSPLRCAWQVARVIPSPSHQLPPPCIVSPNFWAVRGISQIQGRNGLIEHILSYTSQILHKYFTNIPQILRKCHSHCWILLLRNFDPWTGTPCFSAKRGLQNIRARQRSARWDPWQSMGMCGMWIVPKVLGLASAHKFSWFIRFIIIFSNIMATTWGSDPIHSSPSNLLWDRSLFHGRIWPNTRLWRINQNRCCWWHRKG